MRQVHFYIILLNLAVIILGINTFITTYSLNITNKKLDKLQGCFNKIPVSYYEGPEAPKNLENITDDSNTE